MFAIHTAFDNGYSVDKIWQMTNIDKWFLTRLQNLFKMEKLLSYVVVVSLIRSSADHSWLFEVAATSPPL